MCRLALPDEGHIFGPDGVEFLRQAVVELFERPAGWDGQFVEVDGTSGGVRVLES
jgi:hypothetical protein